mmetsp:Transcript_21148/g.58638  ORF Transcript_21148/g.58638 Transcript_21148/m.58638 type:complete len:569 (-) Transcript_21148:271-1977(-)|eukprot:CAMPEP_0179076096 /NCGR_PEP_ID=MMETSP0796-20121207/33927_1 /TAXON_ID=73915 /ORGANISM="Pyrodinium bahamense, Strain pbaha01" /LENGTH=568 /DNA_ID=CAMNT_0020773343 /DNA_START=68 /DNA_END=1774 /DNA_ORIENTATION=+
MAVTLGAGKDVFAAYVKQLMELDEGRLRTSLESLSKYELKEIEGGAGQGAGASSIAKSSTQMVTDTKPTGMTASQAAALDAPPGLALPGCVSGAKAETLVNTPPAKPDKSRQEAAANLDMASMQLQHATNMLQAALANWDACCVAHSAAEMRQSPKEVVCLQDVDLPLTSTSRVATPPVSRVQESPTDAGSGILRQLASVDEKRPTERYGNILEKALGDLTTSLPPEAVAEAQKVLAAAVGQAKPFGLQGKGQDLEVMKWLTQHLEKQQEASAQKVVKLLAANTMGATGYDSTGVVPGQPLPPPGLGNSPVAHGPVTWGHLDARMQPMQAHMPAMPDPAFFPMHPGCPPWWGAAAAASTVAQMMPRMPQAQPPMSPTMHMGVAPRMGGIAQGHQGSPLAASSTQRRRSNPAGDSNDGAGAVCPWQHTGETLRMHLRSLIKIDSGRILIVRKINRLGFSSPELLEKHYTWYGTVERVLVAHSRVKSSSVAVQAGSNLTSRLRPSGLGFVVMSKPEEAEAILAEGPEQIVCGAVIRVQQFERRMTEMEEANGDEETTGGDTNSSEEPQSA